MHCWVSLELRLLWVSVLLLVAMSMKLGDRKGENRHAFHLSDPITVAVFVKADDAPTFSTGFALRVLSLLVLSPPCAQWSVASSPVNSRMARAAVECISVCCFTFKCLRFVLRLGCGLAQPASVTLRGVTPSHLRWQTVDMLNPLRRASWFMPLVMLLGRNGMTLAI